MGNGALDQEVKTHHEAHQMFLLLQVVLLFELGQCERLYELRHVKDFFRQF